MTGYRQKCLREKDERCVECGVTEDIEVHHIDTNRWNNELDNLVPLCHDCHSKVHSSHPEMEHWRELFDPRPPRGEVTEEEIGKNMTGHD
jgi:5-methylcytosine-specific restriction endonuclease McrA